MITGRQIRAARALLDMSQDELAQAAGLTPQGLRKIESGEVQPREGTMADILGVFREHRLEFMDNQGVRFIPEDVEVLNGPDGLRIFFDKVYAHAREHGGIIRQNGIGDKTLYVRAPEIISGQGKRMAPLVLKRRDIFVRAIIPNGDNDFMYTEYADYRWHPPSVPSPVPYYLFGDSVGIFAFDADPSPKIVLITSPTIAAVYSSQFDDTWRVAERPPERGAT